MESKEGRVFFFRGSFEDKKRRFVDEWGGILGHTKLDESLATLVHDSLVPYPP